MVSVERIRACREALLKAAEHLAFVEAEVELEADLVLAEQHAVAQERPHYSPPQKPPAPSWPPAPPIGSWAPKEESKSGALSDATVRVALNVPLAPKIEPLSEDDHSETAYTHWRELLETRLIHGTFTKDQCLCLSPTWFILELRRREPGRF